MVSGIGETVFLEIHIITGQQITQSLVLTLLNTQGQNTGICFRNLGYLLLVIRFVIACLGGDLEGASISSWFNRVCQLPLIDKLTVKIRLAKGQRHQDSFTTGWYCLMDYMNKKNKSSIELSKTSRYFWLL